MTLTLILEECALPMIRVISALFKVPTLRKHRCLLPPYMHDGSLLSLQDVVEHYNTGGSTHGNKSPFIHPLNLSQKEKDDLVSFLESLTDPDFLNNPHSWNK